jgi:tyrosyl-DNA phosphodiesterase-1
MIREFLYEILPTSHKFEDLLKINFDDYDFKDVNIRLITSLPGRFVGNQLYKYGMMRL